MINHKSLMVGCSYNRCPSSSTAPTTYLVACVYSAVPSGHIYIPEVTQGCDDNSRCSNQVANSTCIKEGPYRGLCSQDEKEENGLGSAKATPMMIKSMEKLMATILTSNRVPVH
ncbi:hypothetical protein TELCIR_10627 [Teladorsagia circumcincta]|uniref:Uncharacterized protein n=1 Tax=Teladorsagia circumcincta TaxID=45464 RepID=A0A2G9UBK1_TELCI|nr:hypothetical protein TELCIR_10627 [Teladorsagia circumcincta]